MYGYGSHIIIMVVLLLSMMNTTEQMILEQTDDRAWSMDTIDEIKRELAEDTENRDAKTYDLPLEVNVTKGVARQGKCFARTPCQIIVIMPERKNCFVTNLPGGTECHDHRCEIIAKRKGIFDKFGDKGICLTMPDEENGILVNGKRVTSQCFCDAGDSF